MLSCKDLAEQATEYLEDAVGLRARMFFWLHLGICVHCRRYLRQLRLTSKIAKSLYREAEISDAETEELLARIRRP